MGLHFGDVDVLALAAKAQPAFAHRFIVAAEKEVHVAPEVGQFSAVIKTDRARADDSDPELRERMTRAHGKTI